MEWLTKLLEGKVEGDAITQIVEDAKKDLPLHFVPKHKYNEVAEAKKSLDEAIKDRDKQLNDLKGASGDAETLKATIEQLQNQNKETKLAYESKIKDLQVSTAIENSLKEAKAKHPDLLLGKIDKSKIELKEDGTLAGLNEQLETLKTTYTDLFEVQQQQQSKPNVQGFVPANQAGSNSQNTPNLSDGAKLAQMFNQTQSTATAVDPWKN